MFKEFKTFIMRGNVIDLAVAVVIGAAFGAIITSLVDDIIMPIIGTFIGERFSSLSLTVNGVAIRYGAFMQAIINFLIIAFSIFLVIQLINRMKRKRKEEEKTAPSPTLDQQLLIEIRDLLKDQPKNQAEPID